MPSLLQRLLEPRDFVLQARDAARHRKVVDKEDGPDGEISGHQAIEIFHWASDFFRPKKRRDLLVDARKLLMSMTFARRRFFRLDSTSKPSPPQLERVLMRDGLSGRWAG